MNMVKKDDDVIEDEVCRPDEDNDFEDYEHN